jgi:hypothetical protein
MPQQRLDQGELLGGGKQSQSHAQKSGPPMRPPPPKMGASPARKAATAFDDLAFGDDFGAIGGPGPVDKQQHLFPSSSSSRKQTVEGLLLIHTLLFVSASLF